MKNIKRIISAFLCLALVLPTAILPAAAAGTSELESLCAAAAPLLYSDGTHASRRQLKAAYDTAESLIASGSASASDIASAQALLSAAIDGFVAVASPERRETDGFAAWDAETVSAFTDTSGCAVFFDASGPHGEGVKVVTAGKNVAYFSNAASDSAIAGAPVFTSDLTDAAGLRFYTEFNDLSLVKTVSVSVGVRSTEGRKTYTAADIPAKNGYIAVDWEFFDSDHDAVGTGFDPSELNYIAFSFGGVKPGFIARVSDLHCFAESILSGEKPAYSENEVISITSGGYYKIVDSSTGLALTLSPAVTDTQRKTATGYENHIVEKQTGLTVSMQERRDDPCQEWQLYRRGDGTFRIINRDSSLALNASYYVLNYKIDVGVLDLNDAMQEWKINRSSNGFKISIASGSAYLNTTGGNLKASTVQQVWSVYECARGGWNQVWNDEFDGDSVDRSKWTVYNGHVRDDGKDEPLVFLDNENNVAVSDGNLIIRTRRDEYNGLHYSGGYMTTEGHFYMSYGKVEMRAKLPTGYWIWPALWMMGVNGAWPQNGEIDIMELVGGGIEDSKLYGTLHWTPDYAESSKHFVKGVEIYNKNNISLGDDYHTYGLEWENGQLRIYFDGMQYVSLNFTTDAARWGFGDNPHYLIVNTSIRGKGDRIAYENTAEESEYYIDYIRVSKRAEDMSASVEPIAREAVEGVKIGSYIGDKGASKVAASPNGNYFTVIDREGRVIQHNAKTGEPVYNENSAAGPLYALKYSPSGRYLAAGSRQSGIVIYKSENLSGRAFASAPGVYFEALEFSADESTIFAGGRNDSISDAPGDNKYIYAFSSTGGSLRKKTYLGSDVRSISVSEDGAFIAAGTSSGRIFILSADSFEVLREVDMAAAVRGVRFIPGSSRFAASDEKGNITVYDAKTGSIAVTVKNPDAASVASIDVSPDGSRLVAASSDNNARLFDLGSGRLIALLDGFAQMTTSAKFSPDGNRIAVCSLDGTARIYDSNGGLLYVYRATASAKRGDSLSDIAFSADGASVLAAPIQQNDSVYFWTLTKMVDKTPLYRSILAASEVDASAYTHDSLAKLREALEASDTLLHGHKATAAEIASAVAAINNAANHLVKLPGAETKLNGFEGWTASDVADMKSTRATLSLTSSSISITPNVTQSLCVNATSTQAWTMYNTASSGGISGQNPFGADLSNCDGISIWAKGLTKEQTNGKIFIGYTGDEGSFMFSAPLPTITTEGQYINIPFSSFTHESGEETLDLTKLNTIGFYGKGAKGMFVFTELEAYTEPGETPVLTGVADGATYDVTGGEAPSASWDSGVAFLDGESYAAGTPITEAGTHTLTVNNHGTELTVTFTITDSTPAPVISGVSERRVFDLAEDEIASPSWDVGTATLNGEPYAGAPLNKVGEYTLTVTNGFKTASVFFIVVDTSEVSHFMKGDFDFDGQITVADALSALRIAAKLAEETPQSIEIGDIDGDGHVTVSDALSILRVAAKLADAESLSS